MPLEILDRTLMFLSGGQSWKSPKIPALAGLGIFLARIESKLTAGEFADHGQLLST